MRKITLLLALVVCTLSMQNCSTEEYSIEEEISLENLDQLEKSKNNINSDSNNSTTKASDNFDLTSDGGMLDANDLPPISPNTIPTQSETITFTTKFPTNIDYLTIAQIRNQIKDNVFNSLTSTIGSTDDNGIYSEEWTISKNESIYLTLNSNRVERPTLTDRGDGGDLTSDITTPGPTGNNNPPIIAEAPTNEEREGQDIDYQPVYNSDHVRVNLPNYTYALYYASILEDTNR